MYQPNSDPDKLIAEHYAKILSEPMDPRKCKLLSEMYELNRLVRLIKREIKTTTCQDKLKEIHAKRIEMQEKIIELFDMIDRFDTMN